MSDPQPRKSKHEHQFIMPVAWRYIFDGTAYTAIEATVLRCVCGREIRREGEV